MSFTTLQNTSIELDLMQLGLLNGWTINGSSAIHEICNAGNIYLKSSVQPIISGHSYEISFNVDYINSGILSLIIGSASGSTITTPGFKTQTITATGINPNLFFYSNANCQISLFSIRDTFENTNLKQKTTFVWSEKNNNYPSFRTYNAESGFSLFTNLYMSKNGQLWKSRRDILPRNNFFGVQYKSIVKIAGNANKTEPKTFESISYEANQLLITSPNGITTSLGQISELIDVDFLKSVLSDGVNEVRIYDTEGIYSSGFWKDKNINILNGPPLKGTYITVELINVSDSLLRIKNIIINSTHSSIGSR